LQVAAPDVAGVDLLLEVDELGWVDEVDELDRVDDDETDEDVDDEADVVDDLEVVVDLDEDEDAEVLVDDAGVDEDVLTAHWGLLDCWRVPVVSQQYEDGLKHASPQLSCPLIQIWLTPWLSVRQL